MSRPETIRGGVAEALAHDSAEKHVTGQAIYIDDMAPPAGLAHAYLGLSQVAHGRLKALELGSVRAQDGVLAVLTAADIPGVNDISPTGLHDEPVFVEETILFHGQPLFAVVAETRDAARRAARLAGVEVEPLPALLDVGQARDAGGAVVTEPLTLSLGDAEAAIRAAPTSLVSIPNRYMHSAVETISLEDVDLTADLLAQFAIGLSEADDFTP